MSGQPNLNPNFKNNLPQLHDDIKSTPSVARVIRTDINERTLAELESVEIYRLLVETANEGIILHDGNGKITFANRQMADMLGYKCQVLVGRTILDFMDQDQVELVLDSRRKLSQGAKINNEYKFKRKDGSTLWTLCNATALLDSKGRSMGNLAMHKDITDKKLADIRLRESEKKYRELVKYAPAGIYVINSRSQRFTSVNDAMSEITGYSREELLSMNVADLFTYESRILFEKRTGSWLRGDAPVKKVEYAIKTKHGDEKYIVLRVTFTTDKKGRPLGGTGITHDITERKKAEVEMLKLLRREKLLSSVTSRLLISKNPQGIINELCTEAMKHLNCDVFFNYMADRDTGRLYLNTWGGIPAEDARKIEWLDYGDAVCGYVAQEGHRIIAENINTTFDPRTELVRSYGVQAYACHPLLSGEQVIGTISFGTCSKPSFTDEEIQLMKTVSDHIAIAMHRMMVKEELRQNEQRLEGLVKERTAKLDILNQSLSCTIESISDAFLTLDHKWTVTYWNRAAEKLFTLHRQNALGRYIWDIFPLAESSVFAEHFKIAVKEQNPVSFVARGTCIDRWVAVRAYPSSVGLTVYMQDITKEKNLEMELARLDRLNLIGEMAAGIGHEIRNPMTSVRGFLQMLGGQKEYQNDSPYFELMIEELDRANAIITEYLGMAKNKQVELQLKSMDDLVACLYPILISDANLRGVIICLDLGTPPLVLIDEREIRQLILNIARNGMEAMPEKGTLTIGTIREDEHVVLYIKDEGPGLAPEIESKIGTPFVTNKNGGTGLGLPICYSIAARHKAKIDYETGPAGTTFYIRFPLPVD